MKHNTGLEQFVKKELESRKEDDNDERVAKQIIRTAICYYGLKSTVKVDEVEDAENETLHIASMAEENMLAKLAEFVLGEMDDHNLEFIYSSRVVRDY